MLCLSVTGLLAVAFWPLGILAAILGALSRESTALIVPIYFMASGGDFIGTILIGTTFVIATILKRRWVGDTPRYTWASPFVLWNNLLWWWWWRSWNLPGRAIDFKCSTFIFAVLFITILCLAMIFAPIPAAVAPTAWAAPTLILFSGILFAYMWEPRSFINRLIWFGPILLGAVT